MTRFVRVVVLVSVLVVSCGQRSALRDSGAVVALSVEFPEVDESLGADAIDVQMRDLDGFSAGTGAIAGWSISGFPDENVRFSVSLHPVEDQAVVGVLVAALDEAGAVKVVELGVDDLWPGCSPPECTITVWDTVGSRY